MTGKGQAEPVRNCPYCGEPLRGFRIVCPDHADLPNLDVGFRNPRIVAKPIGVQPFATANGHRLGSNP